MMEKKTCYVCVGVCSVQESVSTDKHGECESRVTQGKLESERAGQSEEEVVETTKMMEKKTEGSVCEMLCMCRNVYVQETVI